MKKLLIILLCLPLLTLTAQNITSLTETTPISCTGGTALWNVQTDATADFSYELQLFATADFDYLLT